MMEQFKHDLCLYRMLVIVSIEAFPTKGKNNMYTFDSTDFNRFLTDMYLDLHKHAVGVFCRLVCQS